MNAIDCFIINIICIVFPLLIYQIYKMNCHNLEKNEEELILYITLASSLYLLLKYGHFYNNGIYQFVFVNLPILLAYYLQEKKFAFLLSIFVIIYEFWNYPNFVFSGIFSGIVYFIVYILLEKRFQRERFISFFLIITVFVFTVSIVPISPQNPMTQIIQILFVVVLFYGSVQTTIWLIQKGNDVLELNSILKELEKEKIIKTSLFQITHEIKNPIAVCKGYLDMMSQVKDNRRKEYLEIIKSEIDRTITLMDDFLDYTKIKINPEIMDITLLLEEVLRELRPLLKNKKIELEVHILRDEIDILGDYNRLKQVFVNILKNSIEAISASRQMKIKIFMKRTKKNVIITIKDNGIGMSKEVLGRCGEMFYTTKVNGTGIGVSLVKTIIERHKGTIQYQSKEGEGTSVIIEIPTI